MAPSNNNTVRLFSDKYPVHGFLNRIIDIVHPSINTDFYKRNILPDNSINIVFPYAGEQTYPNTDNYFSTIRICGQLTQKKEYHTSISTRAIIVKLQPWAAGFFFKEPLHELINANIPLSAIFPESKVKSLEDELKNTNDLLNVILKFLQAHLIEKSIDKGIFHSLQLIERNNGEIRVDKLARSVYQSKRNFERKFRATMGLTPKQFIQNSRFQYALRMLKMGLPLLDVTYRSGYYDQSHFGADFKRITGLTPEQYECSNLSHFYY